MNISGEGIGSVVAEKCSPSHNLVEAELVGVKRLLLVLGERVGERARRRVHRHHENSEAHLRSLRYTSCLVLSCSANGPRT